MLSEFVSYDGFNTKAGRCILDTADIRLIELEAILSSLSLYESSPLVPDNINSHLDYLGPALGYGDFWSSHRSTAAKIALIKNSRLPLIAKGTKHCIEKISSIVSESDTKLWLESAPFIIDVGKTDETAIGTPTQLSGFLTVEIHVARGLRAWSEILKTLEFYSPVTTDIKPCYNQFYTDISVTEEPILS